MSTSLVQMSSRACCGGFAVVVESASHWGSDTGPALGGVPALLFLDRRIAVHPNTSRGCRGSP